MTANHWLKNFFLVACVVSNMIGCQKPQPPSDEEVTKWFIAHYDELQGIVKLCERSPNLRRIELGDMKWIGQYGKRQRREQSRLRSIKRSMPKLGVDVVGCGRSNAIAGAPLVAVDFAIFRRGLVIGGEMKSVRYIRARTAEIPERIKQGNLRPLGRQGWYIYYSKN